MLVTPEEINNLFSNYTFDKNIEKSFESFNSDVPTDLYKSMTEDDLLVFIPSKFIGLDLTLLNLVKLFGFNENAEAPCFYNQDWYYNEKFSKESVQKPRWVLLRKCILPESRGFQPNAQSCQKLLRAVEYAYIFFVIYLKYKVILWPEDYLWTCDYDSHGDQIYVGRYYDFTGIAKNGFSIHRHLSIKINYGYIKSEIFD
jgi:hypothetical protein